MSVSYTWPSSPTYVTRLASVAVRICDPVLFQSENTLLTWSSTVRAENYSDFLTSSSAAPILSPTQVVVAALLRYCPLGLNLPPSVPPQPLSK